MDPQSSTIQETQSERWAWFTDVLFGAISALAIERYEPTVRAAWAAGWGEFLLSVLTALCIGSFVVYDIAIYHALVKKHPYRMTLIGFIRFYLDLVMAFLLYVLLVDAFAPDPAWFAILVTITLWHLAAALWHWLARIEKRDFGQIGVVIWPHMKFIALYWVVAGVGYGVATRVLNVSLGVQQRMLMIISCLLILAVSLYRWNQVIRKVVGVTQE